MADPPIELVSAPEHDATEIIQRSYVMRGRISHKHRGRGDNMSTEKTSTVLWIRRFCRGDLIERIPKSVVIGRRIVF